MYKILIQVIVLSLLILTSNTYCQDSIFTVPLKRITGIRGHAFFDSHRLKEVDDYKQYKYVLHENTVAFVIGRVSLNYYFASFNKRNKNKEERKKFMESFNFYKFDTNQFFQKTFKSEFISALVSIDGKNKRIRVDKNSNFDFNDDEEFVIDCATISQGGSTDLMKYIELSVDIGCISDSSKSVLNIPIVIDTEYRNKHDIIGGNDLLQIYISPNFYYSGLLKFGKDSVNLVLNTQNFDTFYDIYTDVSFEYKSAYQKVTLHRQPNHSFQVNNQRFKFISFNPIDKTLNLSYYGNDSIGNQPGNYLKTSPELENISKYTLLFFTGSWCMPCKFVLDSLLLLNKTNHSIDIININYEKDTMDFKDYLNKNKITWLAILDLFEQHGTSSYREMYEISGFPTLFFVNQDRKILRVVMSKDKCIDLINEIRTNDVEYFER